MSTLMSFMRTAGPRELLLGSLVAALLMYLLLVQWKPMMGRDQARAEVDIRAPPSKAFCAKVDLD